MVKVAAENIAAAVQRLIDEVDIKRVLFEYTRPGQR